MLGSQDDQSTENETRGQELPGDRSQQSRSSMILLIILAVRGSFRAKLRATQVDLRAPLKQKGRPQAAFGAAAAGSAGAGP